MGAWALFSLLISIFPIFSTVNQQNSCTPPSESIWRAGCNMEFPPYGYIDVIPKNDQNDQLLTARLAIRDNPDQANIWVLNSGLEIINSHFYAVDLNQWADGTIYIGIQINGAIITVTDLHGNTKTAVLLEVFNFTHVQISCHNSTGEELPGAVIPEIDVYTGARDPFAADYRM